MAEELTVKERKQKVRKLEKKRVRQVSKADKAAARRKELKEKLKKDKKQLKNADTKKERKAEKKQIAHKKEQRSEARKSQEQHTKRATNITKRRDQAATYKTTKAGTAGVKNDVINPFMNADQIMELQSKQQEQSDLFNNLDYALKNMIADTEYGNHQADEAAVAGRKDTNETSAARGLFNSSIRDAALFDVDATAMALKTDNARKLDAMEQDNARQKLMANQAMTEYQNALNQAMVKNAQDASVGMEEYKVAPTKAKTTQHTLEVPKVKLKGQNNNNGRNGGPQRSDGQASVTGPTGGGPRTNPGGGPTGGRPNVNPTGTNSGPPRNNPTGGRPNR